jgi:hypothetical protein
MPLNDMLLNWAAHATNYITILGGLFNDVVSSSDYIVSYDRMINE